MGKLYVANLPYSATEEELEDLFAQHGEVKSAKIITDRDTGNSRGFGFVEMDNSDEAMNNLNGASMGGRDIAVKPAIDKERSRR